MDGEREQRRMEAAAEASGGGLKSTTKGQRLARGGWRRRLKETAKEQRAWRVRCAKADSNERGEQWLWLRKVEGRLGHEEEWAAEWIGGGDGRAAEVARLVSGSGGSAGRSLWTRGSTGREKERMDVREYNRDDVRDHKGRWSQGCMA
ncbi:hypothetical protein AMTRI_Chr01g130800 [Amborella trichopoda]|uniref:Uncharacterized protein n=1 Tax=Amborella trichopoda TaxID=13333 RepID=W1NR35_AMBTC|nr:hypothetical protein AMTR_s00221p00020340 [Amborella trichopoda]